MLISQAELLAYSGLNTDTRQEKIAGAKSRVCSNDPFFLLRQRIGFLGNSQGTFPFIVTCCHLSRKMYLGTWRATKPLMSFTPQKGGAFLLLVSESSVFTPSRLLWETLDNVRKSLHKSGSDRQLPVRTKGQGPMLI